MYSEAIWAMDTILKFQNEGNCQNGWEENSEFIKEYKSRTSS